MPGKFRSPVLIERLSRDHARIAAAVTEFGQLADTVTAELDWQRLSELCGFLDYYADRIHHPLEDRLFDHLLNKGVTPTERHLVFRNLSQHQEIATLTSTACALIDQARQGGTIDVDEFRELALNYVSLQQRHMRFEEAHLFPLLDAEFDNNDWNILVGLAEKTTEFDLGIQ